MTRDSLTSLGRRWVAVESWVAGPWVGFSRLLWVPSSKGSASGSSRDAPPGDEDVPGALRSRLSMPFVLGTAAGAALLCAKGSPQGFPLATLSLFLVIVGGALGRVGRGWTDRTLMLILVFALDRYYRILMLHCTHLAAYADRAFHVLDVRLFGSWPVTMGQSSTPAATEFFALVYGMFIPYLFSSLLLAALGRTRRTAAAYLFGLTTLYASAYTMYVLWPTVGPSSLGLYPSPLPRGPMLSVLEASFSETQAYAGAFPSLHTAAVVYMLGADLVLTTRRFWIWLPWGVIIVVSTLVLRHHYFIDLVCGAAMALGALVVMRRALAIAPEAP